MRYAALAAALCLPVAARAQFTAQAPTGVLKNLSVTDHKQQVICGADARSGDANEIAPVVQAALAQVQSQPHRNSHTEATH